MIIYVYLCHSCSFIVIPNRSVSFYGPHWPSIKWKKYGKNEHMQNHGKTWKNNEEFFG